MTAEGLTADEREFLSGPGRIVAIDTDLPAKLLRLYGQERARAEAAEESARVMRMTCRVNEADNADQIDRRRGAESRLAEATALLRECARALAGNAYRAELNPEVVRFLSATPTPAAPDQPRALTDYDASDGYKYAPAAESKADTAAGRAIADCRAAIDRLLHPDTIALRECRAELERANNAHDLQRSRAKDAERALESARANETMNAQCARLRAELELQRDMVAEALASQNVTAAALESARAERDTALHSSKMALVELDGSEAELKLALARIADLEASLREAVDRIHAVVRSEVSR